MGEVRLRNEALVFIKAKVIPYLFLKHRWLQRRSTLLLCGSAARDEMLPGSDIDLALFLSALQKKKHFGELFPSKVFLKRRYATSLAIFTVDEIGIPNVWSNDLLVSLLHEGIPVHDTLGLEAYLKKFHAYPRAVLVQKIISGILQIKKTEQSLGQYKIRKNTLGIIESRVRMLKIFTVLFLLAEGVVPNYKHVFSQLAKHEAMRSVFKDAEDVAARIDSLDCETKLWQLRGILFEILRQKKYVSASFLEKGEWWSKRLQHHLSIS